MTTASLAEIKKELRTLDEDKVQELCMKLAKYKKENKELLTYLLFEAHDEPAYLTSIKNELDELFISIANYYSTYNLKKYLRKILRFVNKQLKYSGNKQTEIEVRIYFCQKIKEARIPIKSHAVLYNLYVGQLKKIETTFAKLPEDLKTDYERDLNYILL
jgi:DNA mismatch repair ATPase MutS